MSIFNVVQENLPKTDIQELQFQEDGKAGSV